MNYPEALDYLYSLINYEIQRPDRYAPEVVSLDRPRALLAALGNPQRRYPIIHLTGTKGKGSVSAMCAAALEAAGLRVGLYSSPHLQDFRERFRIGNDLIAPDLIAALVERIRPIVAEIPGLTWFEVVTALAFTAFAEMRVDAAVIEVGLGGRLDATNIIENPVVSVITSLSYDHMHLLGHTIGEIAFEKAGIIKPGVPVVSAPQPPEGEAVIARIAAERGSPLTLVGREWTYATGAGDEFGQRFTAGPANGEQRPYWTPLIGAHQAINGAVATAALSIAAERLPFAPDPKAAIAAGLSHVNWPGRLEVVRRAPHLILDAAHNAASAQFLAESLAKIFLANRPDSRLTLIFGAFTDKDVRGMFAALLPHTHRLILMQPISPRAFSTDQLAALARESGFGGEILSRPAAADALREAESDMETGDVVCATGSLSVVGEMRSVLGLTPGRAAYLDSVSVRALRGGE